MSRMDNILEAVYKKNLFQNVFKRVTIYCLGCCDGTSPVAKE